MAARGELAAVTVESHQQPPGSKRVERKTHPRTAGTLPRAEGRAIGIMCTLVVCWLAALNAPVR